MPAYIRPVFHAGILVSDRHRYPANRETQLGLDQDGLLGRQVLRPVGGMFDWSGPDPDGQVHRFCFALALFHLLLSASLVGVHSTKTKRAAIQNGWVLTDNERNDD